MWRLWKAGDRKAALAAIPDQVVDELIVRGRPRQCREHIARYVENGVTTPALALLPFGFDPRQAIRDLRPADTSVEHHTRYAGVDVQSRRRTARRWATRSASGGAGVERRWWRA